MSTIDKVNEIRRKMNRFLLHPTSPDSQAGIKKRASEFLQKPAFVQLVPVAGLEPATS
jgi:hypothetical protein